MKIPKKLKISTLTPEERHARAEAGIKYWEPPVYAFLTRPLWATDMTQFGNSLLHRIHNFRATLHNELVRFFKGLLAEEKS